MHVRLALNIPGLLASLASSAGIISWHLHLKSVTPPPFSCHGLLLGHEPRHAHATMPCRCRTYYMFYGQRDSCGRPLPCNAHTVGPRLARPLQPELMILGLDNAKEFLATGQLPKGQFYDDPDHVSTRSLKKRVLAQVCLGAALVQHACMHVWCMLACRMPGCGPCRRSAAECTRARASCSNIGV